MKSKEEVLSEVLLELYAPVSGAELPGLFLRTMEKVLPASTYVVNFLNLQSGEWSNYVPKGYEELWAQTEPAWQEFHTEHPTLRAIAEGTTETVMKISDFLSQREFCQTGLYREVLGPFGGRDQIGLSLPAPGFFGGTAINRDRVFTEEERCLMAMLQPHFLQALRNAHLRDSLAVQAQSAIPAGSITLTIDASGKATSLRKAAYTLLSRYFAHTSPTSRLLPQPLRGWARQAMAQISFLTAAPIPPLEIEGADGRLTCRLLPNYTSSPPAHLLVLSEQAHAHASINTLLRRLPLTRVEGEVLAAIIAGKTNGEIAHARNRSIGTVEKHVMSVFRKLNVSTRAEAVARALSPQS